MWKKQELEDGDSRRKRKAGDRVGGLDRSQRGLAAGVEFGE